MRGSLACLLVTLLLISSTSFAQDDPPVFDEEYLTSYAATLYTPYPVVQDYNGGGARARAMGNAFIGVSDDVTAVSWNPAGLYRREALYEQPVLGLGYRSHKSDATFRDKPWGVWEEFDHSDTYNSWDLMSIIFPLRVKGHVIVGSLAYTRIGDEAHTGGMQVDTTLYYDLEDYLAGIQRPFGYQFLENYRSSVNALNIGFGTRIYGRWTFGVALNAYSGHGYRYSYENARWDELELTNLPGGQRAVVEVVNQIYDTASYSGVYFTIGFQYDADRWKLGLVMKTPHTLKQETDIFVDHSSLANGAVIVGTATGIHLDNNVTELDEPFTIGAGVSVDVTKNFLFAVDLEYRAFGGGQIHYRDSLVLVPGGTDIEYFSDYDSYWNDVWSMRLGGEFLWETGSSIVPVVPLRAGLNYTQIPSPNVDGGGYEFNGSQVVWNPVTSTAAMNSFSFGSGAQWEQVHLDVAVVFTNYDRESALLLQESSVDNTSFNVTFTGFF